MRLRLSRLAAIRVPVQRTFGRRMCAMIAAGLGECEVGPALFLVMGFHAADALAFAYLISKVAPGGHGLTRLAIRSR
ncbi:hypothetical protein Trco_006774 [Trichoderma cornu-damae]|uniref:Uncharacterized protein n=1 Tax=Trichoderma cornu-damae TaxID=654480 RepID=A0A9P8QMG8_9HYPO|nr:hypothetical protein Trco_006774 [Trichoderma cornu-damae]